MSPRANDGLSFPSKSPSCKQLSNEETDNCSLTQYGSFSLTQSVAGTEAEATHFKGELPGVSWCECLMFREKQQNFVFRIYSIRNTLLLNT